MICYLFEALAQLTPELTLAAELDETPIRHMRTAHSFPAVENPTQQVDVCPRDLGEEVPGNHLDAFGQSSDGEHRMRRLNNAWEIEDYSSPVGLIVQASKSAEPYLLDLLPHLTQSGIDSSGHWTLSASQ